MDENTQEQSESKETQEESKEETQVEVEEELTDEQVTEQVSKLTGEVQASEETQEEAQEETQASEETEEQTIPIIDDEMIKQYPVLRSYYGKPVTDLAPTYANIVSKFTQNSQELKETKNKLAELSLQDIGDMPDSVDKPEEFKKWLKDRDEKILQTAKVEPQVDIIAELATRLPAGTDVKTLVDGWANENAQRLFDTMGNLRDEMQSLYQNNPEVLYQEVSAFQKSQAKENEDEAVVRKAGHKKLQSDFKKARNSKKDMPNSNVQTISKEVKLTEEEEMLQRIGELIQEE